MKDALVGPVRLRRFGILGDIHAEHEMLAVALEYLSRQNLDAVLSVGDVVDGPGDVNACCRLLVESQAAIVRGNHERWFLEGKMRDLPEATRDEDVDLRSRTNGPTEPSQRTEVGDNWRRSSLGQYEVSIPPRCPACQDSGDRARASARSAQEPGLPVSPSLPPRRAQALPLRHRQSTGLARGAPRPRVEPCRPPRRP